MIATLDCPLVTPQTSSSQGGCSSVERQFLGTRTTVRSGSGRSETKRKQHSVLTYCWVMNNDQNIRALCQFVQYSGKICQLHLQRVELLTDTRTGMLESLDEF